MDKHIEANAELAADLLRHMADNEIDSDYFAVVTDSPNCGREIQSEHKVTDTALMVAGVIDQLLAKLEAAEKGNEFLKEQLAQLANFNPDWDKLEACQESWRELAELQKETLQRAEAAEARLLVPVKLPSEFYFHSSAENIPVMRARHVEEAIHAAGFLVEGDK